MIFLRFTEPLFDPISDLPISNDRTFNTFPQHVNYVDKHIETSDANQRPTDHILQLGVIIYIIGKH